MSRDYASVSPAFWTGETGRALRGDAAAQLTALFLVTSRHANMIGVFHIPPIFIAHETGLPLESVLQAIQRLSALGFCEYDAEKELIWIINNQLGRRNLHPDQASYLRGKRYNSAMRDKSLSQNDKSSQTHERLAEEYKVSPATITRVSRVERP